ncbi:hypothetical protein [Brachybacterium massiliense]|uniref:hypothetical protein n=1 Tax=Brachybacterium massiliense TaxID=1755098 RepID=UPI000B3BC9DA|nr:hypothetical protein [Brachybacterium massiliense]
MTSFELIGTMRDRLEDVRQWREQLSDVMLTISGYSMDLTGIRGTTDRIPGGDALTMLGPWAADADHGDDLPHPDQVLREWRETITEERRGGSWEECWRWHWDSAPRILETPWGEEWQQDLTALWWRLARLTGNAPKHEEDTMRGALDCIAARDDLPPELRLTARDADRFWPGIEQRLKDDRHHKRPTPERSDDRTYLVTDLREYWACRLASIA